MAIIVGLTDSEEVRVLQEAGYDFATLETIQSLFTLGSSVVAIWVDCDITDLLSPPLCKFCGRLMETHSETCQVGTRVIHTCPNCEAWIAIRAYPPKE